MTQGQHPDRYVIRELTGYPMSSQGGAAYRVETTDVYVFDTWEGFAIVAAYKPHGNNASGHNSVEERRLQAQSRCDALNEAHRRWLHSGRWASKVPEMQAAEQGEAAQALKGKGSR